ncbi:MAG: winged helix-turn-helix domain-containing protein [bacterium]
MLTVGDLVVDTARQSAGRGLRSIDLTSKEYAFLEYLARHSGRIVSRAELSTHVWDDNHNPFSNLIDVYAGRVRRKINGSGEAPLLSTRRGMGHMLAAPSLDSGLSPVPAHEDDSSARGAKRKSGPRRRQRDATMAVLGARTSHDVVHGGARCSAHHLCRALVRRAQPNTAQPHRSVPWRGTLGFHPVFAAQWSWRAGTCVAKWGYRDHGH